MHQRALACATRSDHGQHFSGLDLQIDSMKHGAGVFAVVVGEGDILEPDRPRKLRQTLCSWFFPYFVLNIHEAKNFGRGSQRLLRTVIEERKLAHRIVELEHRNNKSKERSRRKQAFVDLIAP